MPPFMLGSRWRRVAPLSCGVVSCGAAAWLVVALAGPGQALAQPNPASFMDAARSRAGGGGPPVCPKPVVDEAGIVQRSVLIEEIAGEAASATGGLSRPLLLVTRADDGPARPALQGTLRWAVEAARKAGGGWIAFSPELDGRTVHTVAVLRLPSNTTVDGGCGGITLTSPARVTTLMIENESNVVIGGLSFVKDSYRDVEDKTGDAIGLNDFADRVAVLHNDFRRCGDGCVDIVRKHPIDRIARVTVAFNHFADHNKVMLVGSLTCYANPSVPGCDAPLAHLGDSMRPLLRVTLNANVFEGTSQRHPKVVTNGLIESTNNLIVLKPTTYPDGRTSAVYGAAAASGGLLLSRGDVFVNPSGQKRIGAGPVSAVTVADASRGETDGAVAIEDAIAIGPVELVQASRQTVLAYAAYPLATVTAKADPVTFAACLLRIVGPGGVALGWPSVCSERTLLATPK